MTDDAAHSEPPSLREALRSVRAALSDASHSADGGVGATEVMGELRAIAAQLTQLAGGHDGRGGALRAAQLGMAPRRKGSGSSKMGQRSKSWDSRHALERAMREDGSLYHAGMDGMDGMDGGDDS